MADVTVDTSELDHLVVFIDAAQDRVGADLAAVVRRSGAAIEARAKINAPVDTGYLRNSITTTVTGDGRFSEMAATVTAGADYAAYVEFGTYKTAPQPFMVPALDGEVPNLLAAIEAVADRL